MQTLKQSMLVDILKQNGYHFGEIWRLNDEVLGAIVPILINEDIELTREYIMMEEVKDKEVITITDSGSIDTLKIKMIGDDPVFVRQGTAFKGQGTQSRANQMSVVIMPIKKEQEVPCRCIHASHHISEGSEFKRYGYVPRATLCSLNKGQRETWASINNPSDEPIPIISILPPRTIRRTSGLYARAGGSSATLGLFGDGITSDNLIEKMESLKKGKEKVSEWIKKVPCFENQVGVVILDSRGVYSIEIFNHPSSWKAFHEGIIENYEDILSKKPAKGGLFEFKEERIPEIVEEFIIRFSALKGTEVYKQDKTMTYLISDDGMIGEYTVLNSKIIHILGMREDKTDQKQQGTNVGWNILEEPRSSRTPSYNYRTLKYTTVR